MDVIHLGLHIGLTCLIVILLITLFRVRNQIGWGAMLTIAICGSSLFFSSVKILKANFESEQTVRTLRDNIFGAARGDHNLKILNKEYRLQRVPRNEDDEDDSPEDDNPEIPA